MTKALKRRLQTVEDFACTAEAVSHLGSDLEPILNYLLNI